MPRRPATTVLLITRHLIARADFAPNQSLQELWTQPRPDVNEWPTLVEVALDLGPQPGRNTYVLCSDLWTQTLSLTNISTKKMADDEMAAALNFEAETLSGQSAFESSVALQALPAGNEYWIVQPRTADFAQAEQIVQQAGSRLAGLAHPGGLPGPLTPRPSPAVGRGESGAPWVRIEFWPDAVLLLRGDAAGKIDVQVVNADPQTGRWKTEWEAWRQDAGSGHQTEALIGPGAIVSAPDLANPITLEKDAELSAWLTVWAKQLAGKTVAAPLLRPTKKPMSTGRRWAIAVGLLALVTLSCGSLHYSLEKNLQVVRTEKQRVDSEIKKLADVQKQADDLKAKQSDIKAHIDGMETSMKVLATHRLRLSRFLTKMSELYPEHLYVEKIEIEGGEPRLRGQCLQPELADQFARQLAHALKEQGWELSPSSKAALIKADNGAPWSFDIQLVSAKEMKLENRAEAKKGPARKK